MQVFTCVLHAPERLICYTLVYNGYWEWDDAKNELNLKKHGFNFWTAGRVFDDPNHLIVKDRVDAETGEQRWHAIGLIHNAVITLSHTYRSNEIGPTEEIIHFISAFAASPGQGRKYFTQNLE